MMDETFIAAASSATAIRSLRESVNAMHCLDEEIREWAGRIDDGRAAEARAVIRARAAGLSGHPGRSLAAVAMLEEQLGLRDR